MTLFLFSYSYKVLETLQEWRSWRPCRNGGLGDLAGMEVLETLQHCSAMTLSFCFNSLFSLNPLKVLG
ncbi:MULTISPECIES: hypothetical protein [unclassified Arenibacter]|uniref:hypothetical protein n=1 Tax=unclassified Arenibacter TaxID=2615047 RepID=UPI000E34FFD3|nr:MULTISPECIES: hypothetical protein [unclassified Arenibacter]MCM4165445.1 hypothetical protein [Arenibacter sp. A80]RFT54915.1 hypothetical protein D0S24_17745 [Arenibacter sp. P308M17]